MREFFVRFITCDRRGETHGAIWSVCLFPCVKHNVQFGAKARKSLYDGLHCDGSPAALRHQPAAVREDAKCFRIDPTWSTKLELRAFLPVRNDRAFSSARDVRRTLTEGELRPMWVEFEDFDIVLAIRERCVKHFRRELEC